MSSFVYGLITAKRAAAPAGQSQTTAAPAMRTYVDTLAALVPAEALALYAGIVLPNVTNTVSVHGKAVTVISDPNLLGWSCAGLLVLSAGLYILGRYKTDSKRNIWDVLRAFIPPAAFTTWMLVQNPGVFDVWWPGSSMAGHVVIAAFAAVVLGVLASVLGYQVDQAAPTPAVTGIYPATGPMAGGDSVTVTGSGFTGATGVNFGSAAATNMTVASDSQLTVTCPAADADGAVDVTVTTPTGTSAISAADQFIYASGGT
jgi:hypothetical protein